MHKPRTVHRLDRRPHTHTAVTLLDPPDKPGQTIPIRRCLPDLDTLTTLIQQAIIQTLPTQIQTSMQHTKGPPSRSLFG